ncbi:MAG: selenium cofactor biosynthesis protein YqeC [Arenicellales bacterium]
MVSTIPERSVDLVDALEAGRGVVCLVGAGGKKSTIYQIVARFAGRVAITSTVHIPPFRKRLAAETLIAPNEDLERLVAGASDCRIVAYACPSDKKARLAGVDPALATELHESCGFDLTLVKADGARLRWIKAPASHEPALPERFTTLIPLVSVRCVGELLDQTVAHRPEAIAELVGTRVGDRITGDHVARLLAHPAGGMKGADCADRVVPVINMVDTDEQKYTARLIADRVLEWSPRVDRVVLARMVSDEPVVSVVSR